MTDKNIVEIPEGVEFPREVKQFKVGGMQVFECPAADNSKPIVLYIHGGAYVNNFSSRHWESMAEWAEMTGCGIVTPNYPLLFRYTAKDAHPLMIQLYKQLLERYPAKRIMMMGDSAGGGFPLALTQELQADSMLTEIAAFFEQDADYSTMGMIVNIDLQNDFLIYVYESAIIDYSHLGFSHDADCSISLFDNLAKK